LAVCSCTILPLFSSIHKRGAGLGPAIAFLYSGPAINILAIILTARILGFEMGVARVIGAVSFSVIIGLAMSLIYRKEEKAKREEQVNLVPQSDEIHMSQTSVDFFALVFMLVLVNCRSPARKNASCLSYYICAYKLHVHGFFSLFLIYSLNF